MSLVGESFASTNLGAGTHKTEEGKAQQIQLKIQPCPDRDSIYCLIKKSLVLRGKQKKINFLIFIGRCGPEAKWTWAVPKSVPGDKPLSVRSWASSCTPSPLCLLQLPDTLYYCDLWGSPGPTGSPARHVLPAAPLLSLNHFPKDKFYSLV